jgi:meso-butanediol dehydrogenase/(S,S)-butanediol dehydrogenase/diacetyl reductase
LDPRRHDGKTVLITGGGSGFGRATSLRFANEGAAHVVIVDRLADRLERVSHEIVAAGAKASTVCVDLATYEGASDAVAQALEHTAGALDVAVSNAAAWTDESFLEMPDESWARVIAVNLNASFVVGQRSARAMVAHGKGGVILYTASVSSLGASPNFAHYSAAKAGMANLVTTMAIELVKHGIRVNAVSPGPADTQQSVDLVGEELMQKWRREGFPVVPMGRLAADTDIAAAFSYLASDDASYITGINLVVDGGLTAHAYSVPEQ